MEQSQPRPLRRGQLRWTFENMFIGVVACAVVCIGILFATKAARPLPEPALGHGQQTVQLAAEWTEEKVHQVVDVLFMRAFLPVGLGALTLVALGTIVALCYRKRISAMRERDERLYVVTLFVGAAMLFYLIKLNWLRTWPWLQQTYANMRKLIGWGGKR